MHESALARQILELSLAAAARAAGPGAVPAAILAVRGRVAETESLSGESIELQFRAHARGTPAAGARLELLLVHVEARCRACAEVYRPEHHVLLCPRCGSLDGEPLGEAGLWIESIELAEEDGHVPRRPR